ncbi:oxygen-dependent protoporphyrinogen oxidase [Gracilibacillus halotolerans]|uniref:Coproporphyrinogen III oxidase n=1 Tax=Gracilibacillus halotolerans TaxID=74386 RepID=A0A841RLZ6_9BACI|nr:oxygen-dependent protoporphyrinogen oxidase [Gracilibacillus halotolerans]
MKRVVIVGGGIAGLTTAFYLNKAISENQLDVEVKLLEASDRFGGKINTIKKSGFTIERGPDSFLIRKPSAERLARHVGLGEKLVKNGTGKSYVLKGDKLYPMPQGSFMGIPIDLEAFFASDLLSDEGKARVKQELTMEKSEPMADQSLGKFFKRHFGEELVENLIEPLLSGIYAGDLDELSLMATFPNFYQLEQKYGSLIKGLQDTLPPSNPNAKKESKFFSIEGGLEALVNAITSAIQPEILKKNVAVEHIEYTQDGYRLNVTNGEVYEADAVLFATPYNVTKTLLAPYLSLPGEMKATSVANVAMAFDLDQIKDELDGTGFVVSRNSDYRITACTWTHKKWPETTVPENKALLRCYVGRPGDEEIIHYSDEELEEFVLNDLNKVMKIEGKPLFSVVSRWEDGMPQYSIGHQEFVGELEEQLATKLPGVFVAGSSYRGIGIPDCIDQGEVATDKLLDYIQNKV